MSWALINTVQMQLNYWIWETVDGQQINVQTSIDAVPGTVMDIIVYDGVSPYQPPEGITLMQVPDTAAIGDTGYTPS